MKLSLCIVGCGSYARKVLDDAKDMADEFRFFFASRDAEKAMRYSEMYGGSGYFGSYEEAAQSAEVDAMYFLTPHHLHLENAVLAAANSKHVLVEKPIGRTMEEGREMTRATRDAGVRLMVAENYRFLSTVAASKELMAEGVIGDLRTVHLLAEWYGEEDGWRMSTEYRGGGSFIDAGIHYVDLLVNLGGLPESVYAASPPRVLGKGGEDGMAVVTRLPGGAVGLIMVSNGTPRSQPRIEVAVTGTRGTLTYEPFGKEIELDSLEGRRTIELEQGGRGVREMLREFRKSVLEDREPSMSGEEGMKDLAVVLAAYRSAERGETVGVSLT